MTYVHDSHVKETSLNQGRPLCVMVAFHNLKTI